MKNLLLKVIVVGKLKDKHLAAKCDEYLRRLSAYGKVELIELKDSNAADEAPKIRKLYDPTKDLVLALGEEGKLYDSNAFAQLIGNANRRVVLIIGGPYGLDDSIKSSATQLLSLSPMTFTHEMARFFLLEQLYRAGSILNGSGYHH